MPWVFLPNDIKTLCISHHQLLVQYIYIYSLLTVLSHFLSKQKQNITMNYCIQIQKSPEVEKVIPLSFINHPYHQICKCLVNLKQRFLSFGCSHFSANACLAPVCSMHGLAVTTVEGIGSVSTRIHPVQERIAKAHGSQCGFCTPGIVMSMYTLLRSMPKKPTMEDMEVAFQGIV